MSKSRWILAAALLAFVGMGLALPGAADAGRRHRGGWGGCCGAVSSCCGTFSSCNTCDTGCCGGYTASYAGASCCGSETSMESGPAIQSSDYSSPSGGQTFVPPPPTGAKAGSPPPAPPSAPSLSTPPAPASPPAPPPSANR